MNLPLRRFTRRYSRQRDEFHFTESADLMRPRPPFGNDFCARARLVVEAYRLADASSSVKKNVVPLPGSDSTQMRPP